MNKNIFITNETARKDPAVIAAMASILKRMTDERDRKVAGIAPNTVEVSPVNFLQDVMDDLGDPQIRDREREEYYRSGWGDSRQGCFWKPVNGRGQWFAPFLMGGCVPSKIQKS